MTAYHVQPWSRRGPIRIYCCSPSHCELGTNTGRQRPSKASLLRQQVTTRSWSQILTLGESHIGCGPRYAKASPLFLSLHSGRSNPTALEVRASDCWLHWKDRHIKHHSRSFWHQVHASDLYKGPSPSWLGGQICWTISRSSSRGEKHGRKTSWGSLYARDPMLEGVHWWRSESKGVRSGASPRVS